MQLRDNSTWGRGMFGQDFGYWEPEGGLGGRRSYDLSGILQGSQMLRNAIPYQAQAYSPFQYNTENFRPRSITEGLQPVRQASVGPYGMPSSEFSQDVFNKSFQAGAKPIMAQSAERMRQMTQGMAGARGGAVKGLQLQNAMETGNQLQNLVSPLAQQMAQARMDDERLARQQDYGERRDMEKDYQAQRVGRESGLEEQRRLRAADELDLQQMRINQQVAQAAENYKAAGFSDQQARYLAESAISRAQAMMGYGFQFPQLQASLYENYDIPYNQVMADLARGVGTP